MSRRSCGKLRNRIGGPAHAEHHAHEHDQLRNGLVIHLILVVQERVPSIQIRKLLLDSHHVGKVLGKIGGNRPRHSEPARYTRRKRERGTLLHFKVDDVKRQFVQVARGKAGFNRRRRNSEVGINLGKTLLELSAEKNASVDLHALKARGTPHDSICKLFSFPLLGSLPHRLGLN